MVFEAADDVVVDVVDDAVDAFEVGGDGLLRLLEGGTRLEGAFEEGEEVVAQAATQKGVQAGVRVSARAGVVLLDGRVPQLSHILIIS